MAVLTSVTFQLGTEAQAEKIINAVCDEAGVTRSGANAKQVIKELIEGYVRGHIQRMTPPPVVEGIT
jgi:hypothetical protein